MSNFGNAFRRYILTAEFVNPSDRVDMWVFEGCTDADLALLMAKQQVDFLPGVYTSFMKTMGRKGGEFFARDQIATFPWVAELKDDVHEWLAESQPYLKLPSDALVFSRVSNLGFDLVRTSDQKDDPVVYRYHAGNNRFDWFFNNLSAYYLWSFAHRFLRFVP